MPTMRQPQQANPARSVVSANPMPAVPAEAEAMAVSSASWFRMVRMWASAAPKAMSSAAPSVRSTMAAARSPRTAANRASRRRASNPVSHGTTVAASTRDTARITAAAGSIHHSRTTVETPTTRAMPKGGTTRRTRSCMESTSWTMRARRSPRRNEGRPEGASRSSRS